MLKHWSRCSDKELFAKIVYKAITTYHACQDARMKKLVSVATNRLVGNSSLHHVKKAYEVMVRYNSEQRPAKTITWFLQFPSRRENSTPR